jgi:hypothetical protein
MDGSSHTLVPCVPVIGISKIESSIGRSLEKGWREGTERRNTRVNHGDRNDRNGVRNRQMGRKMSMNNERES